MPIQLDKIISDIAAEKVLKPNGGENRKMEVEEAWIKVGKKNNLTAHEVRSIFKVLQKKYEQERQKTHSSWKLFDIVHEMHQPAEQDPDEAEDEEPPMEEDEEYEMLDVQEDEDQQQHTEATTSNKSDASDGESPSKSKSDTSQCSSPDRGDRQLTSEAETKVSPREEKKLLNTLISSNTLRSSLTTSSTSAAAVALQKKGITLRPATNLKPKQQDAPQQAKPLVRNGQQYMEKPQKMQLTESMKRKIANESYSTGSPVTKKIHLGSILTSNQPTKTLTQTTTQQQSLVIKKEKEDVLTSESNTPQNTGNTIEMPQGINLITVPANSSINSNGNGKISSNGIGSPRIEDIDLSKSIIFDPNATGTNEKLKISKIETETSEKALNLEQVDNALARTFFKNLCNSPHEALGLYVANVMNRLSTRAANRLELNILRAIIEAQNETLTDS